jgi:hypothetical protein
VIYLGAATEEIDEEGGKKKGMMAGVIVLAITTFIGIVVSVLLGCMIKNKEQN